MISNQALKFRCWDDEFVIYNSLSGDTHLMSWVAAQILLKLLQAPSNTSTLIESLSHELPTETDDALAFQIESILADLDKLALIERT